MRQFVVLLAFLVFCSFTSIAQDTKTSYQVESFSSFSTGENTPFWMLYHNWGMVPLAANNFYLRGGVFHKQALNKDWSFRLGLDVAGSSPHAYSTVWIQQAYGELNWKGFRMDVGAKENYWSLLDPNISAGDFCFSNNARPIPEVRVSIQEFVSVPYTKERLYIKGDFAIGKYFDCDYLERAADPYKMPYLKDVLSHHKSIFFRLGNYEKGNRWCFTYGLAHHAQWGGTLYNMSEEEPVIHLPKKMPEFFRVLIAKEGGSEALEGDRINVAGSHWGSHTFKLDYKLNKENEISLYLHRFFEDGSSMSIIQSPRDMMLGAQYKGNQKSLLSNILFEYIYTKQQSGPIHFLYPQYPDYNGNDNYYHNYSYIQGPSYFGRTQGTPLFLSPEYNEDGRLNFKSSRIISFHLGAEGCFSPNLSYQLLATTGQTWGRYYIPYASVKKGFASNLDLIYKPSGIHGLDIKLSMGFNQGSFFEEDAFGMGITITKHGIIK